MALDVAADGLRLVTRNRRVGTEPAGQAWIRGRPTREALTWPREKRMMCAIVCLAAARGGEAMITSTTRHITEDQKRQYREEGFFLLDQVIPPDQLDFLRSECNRLVEEQEEEMDRQGTDTLNLSRRNKRYFIFLAYKTHPQLGAFIFSDLMADLCRATIGEDAMLFWEQFVVKGTDSAGSAFSWHQDSGYVDNEHRPYVNFWIPLDDVTEENGTIYLLPYSVAGTRNRIEHVLDESTGDRVGYFGDEKGVPMVAPAGSIAVFSSTVFHRSGPNLTDRMRRAYAIQHSPEPVLERDGSLKGLAEPFLVDGKQVR
jgi:ectoine hydroxylase-related dioxygenase (phytanoyl-CoA dioxygenase family)